MAAGWPDGAPAIALGRPVAARLPPRRPVPE